MLHLVTEKRNLFQWNIHMKSILNDLAKIFRRNASYFYLLSWRIEFSFLFLFSISRHREKEKKWSESVEREK